MKRNAKTVAIIILLVASISIVAYVIFPLDHYRFELQNADSSIIGVSLQLRTYDANISVSYVNDPTLVYSMDVELYQPASQFDVFSSEQSVEFSDSDSGRYASAFYISDESERIKHINLTISSALVYVYVRISGLNLNVSIFYSNGVHGNQNLDCHFGGNLLVTLNENVGTTNTTFEVIVEDEYGFPPPDKVFLVIDLPDEMNGLLWLLSCIVTIPVNLGWFYHMGEYPNEAFRTYDDGSWSVQDIPEPHFYIAIDGADTAVFAWLSI